MATSSSISSFVAIGDSKVLIGDSKGWRQGTLRG